VIRGQQGAYAAAYGSCFTNDSIRTGSGLAPLGCNQYVWGSEQEAALRSANDQFPFGFTSQPFRARIDIRLPLFANFSRSQQLSQAKAFEADLAESVRRSAVRRWQQAFLDHRAPRGADPGAESPRI
jgi:hypothetical protein